MLAVERNTFREEQLLKSIAVDPDGNPWAVKRDGAIFRRPDPSPDIWSLYRLPIFYLTTADK
jgi:streptogramin lyase